MQPKKATGTRGSWFATVDGEVLPCVHDFWWVKDNSGRYNDYNLRSTPQSEQFVAAIREKKRVILTSDKPYSPESPAPFTRTGYIAVWSVNDVEFDKNGLRFRFVKKLSNLK